MPQDTIDLATWRAILDLAARQDGLALLRARCKRPTPAREIFAGLQAERDRLHRKLTAEAGAVAAEVDALFVAAQAEACRWSTVVQGEAVVWPWASASAPEAAGVDEDMLAVLQETTEQLLGELDLKRLLAPLVRRTATLLRAESALLALWNPAGEGLEVVESHGFEHLMSRQLPVRRGDMLDDQWRCDASCAECSELMRVLGVPPGATLQCTPLRVRGEPLGLLLCVSARPDPTAPAKLRVLASQVTVALRNAALYRDALEKALALREANARLRDMDRVKDEFLATITHELRTPINFITGFGSILLAEEEAPLAPEQQHFVEQMMQGAYQLLSLVEDLLDYSSMRAGQLSLQPEALDLEALLAGVLLNARGLAMSQGLRLELDTSGALPAWRADRQRLVQVLSNMLTNAIKFSPESGRVVLRARLVGDRLRLEVVDEGPGIPAEKQGLLFERFSQLDTGPRRVSGGVGLGLAICKSLVEAHGGDIGVVSPPPATAALTPGRGSMFWVELPQGMS